MWKSKQEEARQLELSQNAKYFNKNNLNVFFFVMFFFPILPTFIIYNKLYIIIVLLCCVCF